MATRDLDQICEIAARLNEAVGRLRKLGLNHAADLLASAEADLDAQLYAKAGGQEILFDELVFEAPAQLPRAKRRQVGAH